MRGASCKKSLCETTSYGGIIRIRLKGRSSITSSQPASQAPLYLFLRTLYICFSKNTRGFLKNRNKYYSIVKFKVHKFFLLLL